MPLESGQQKTLKHERVTEEGISVSLDDVFVSVVEETEPVIKLVVRVVGEVKVLSSEKVVLLVG